MSIEVKREEASFIPDVEEHGDGSEAIIKSTHKQRREDNISVSEI